MGINQSDTIRMLSGPIKPGNGRRLRSAFIVGHLIRCLSMAIVMLTVKDHVMLTAEYKHPGRGVADQAILTAIVVLLGQYSL